MGCSPPCQWHGQRDVRVAGKHGVLDCLINRASPIMDLYLNRDKVRQDRAPSGAKGIAPALSRKHRGLNERFEFVGHLGCGEAQSGSNRGGAYAGPCAEVAQNRRRATTGPGHSPNVRPKRAHRQVGDPCPDLGSSYGPPSVGRRAEKLGYRTNDSILKCELWARNSLSEKGYRGQLSTCRVIRRGGTTQ